MEILVDGIAPKDRGRIKTDLQRFCGRYRPTIAIKSRKVRSSLIRVKVTRKDGEACDAIFLSGMIDCAFTRNGYRFCTIKYTIETRPRSSARPSEHSLLPWSLG